MKHVSKIAVCVLATLPLAGCGSSATDAAATPTFADLTADAVAMQSQYTDANGDLLAGVTPASSAEINASANGTYTGYVGGVVDGDGLIGNLTVAADFGANTATNTATDFIHETDGAYAGTLTGAGVLQPTAPVGTPQVSTSLDGTLSNGGTDYVTSLALDGSFVANGADPTGAIAGTADGTVGADLLTGTFVAER